VNRICPKREIRLLGFLRHATTRLPSFSFDQPPREREEEKEKKEQPLGGFGARRCRSSFKDYNLSFLFIYKKKNLSFLFPFMTFEVILCA
jgi:hypothetical protein